MPTGQKLEHLNRRISVIFIDENFEVFETLQSVTSFDEYKYNIFLIIHLDQF
jgi:hypothetical protein